MKYYPKSQIKTGLSTKGQEFILALSKQSYTGKYWGTSDGKFYTGENPDSKNIQEIIPIVNINPTNLLPVNINPTNIEETSTINSYYIYDQGYFNAKNLSSNVIAPSISKSYVPVPSQEDYIKGYIDRYFIKKTNEIKYIEISYQDYLKYIKKSPEILSELYNPLSLKWYISGDIEQVKIDNQSTIYKIERQYGWYNFSTYINKFDFLYK